MKKRREMGIVLVIALILVCALAIYLMKKYPAGEKKSGSYYNNSISVENDISVTDAGESRMVEGEEEDLWIIFDELRFQREGSTTKTMIYSVLLIVYVILIGPILYFHLKKKDKMEWMWCMIPGCSLFFAAILLLLGDTVSVNVPQVDALTFITPDQKDRVYLSMTSLGRESYSLTFDSIVERVTPLYLSGEYRLSENGVVREEQEYILDESEDGTTLVMQPEEAFSKDYFCLILDDTHEGTIEAELSFQEDAYVGHIVNDTEWDFSDVMLFYQDSFYVISQLAQEDVIEIRKEGWINMNEEELWIGPGKNAKSEKKDYGKILNFAYFKYYSSDAYGEQICIAGVLPEHANGVKKEEADMVSYGLYYQLAKTQ